MGPVTLELVQSCTWPWVISLCWILSQGTLGLQATAHLSPTFSVLQFIAPPVIFPPHPCVSSSQPYEITGTNPSDRIRLDRPKNRGWNPVRYPYLCSPPHQTSLPMGSLYPPPLCWLLLPSWHSRQALMLAELDQHGNGLPWFSACLLVGTDILYSTFESVLGWCKRHVRVQQTALSLSLYICVCEQARERARI